MLECLNKDETDMMYLFVYGQTCRGIMDMLDFDYIVYKRTRKSLLRKLKISRITEILPLLVENGISLI